MLKKGSLVIYKTRPALILEIADKITISMPAGGTARVREKDLELVHPGPLSSLAPILEISPKDNEGAVKETWELLDGAGTTLREAAELSFGAWTAETAYKMRLALEDGLYFAGSPEAMMPRPREAVEEALQKREAKSSENAEREAFLSRLPARALVEGDRHFLQDVEALALGRTDKSRTMKDAHLSQTPEAAHALLLETGVWDAFVNPHPERSGCPLSPASSPVAPPPPEARKDLSDMPAFAIDNEGSGDPDDALSAAEENGNFVLYVHVADPAASVLPGSAADRETCERGATVYLPETVYTMLSPEALPLFALGLQELSPALTFRLALDENMFVRETDIFPSLIKVTRLTYRDADAMLTEGHTILSRLQTIANSILKRRLKNGALMLDFPEVKITASLEEKSVSLTPLPAYESQALVRECMLAAGEGAAEWALRNHIPFPFVSQETGDLPSAVAPGFAGAYQLRRAMRPRTLSNKPGLHWALGLDTYSQVTSPLRRYTDLLAHQQIRAFLKGAPPLSGEEVLSRLLQAERGALCASRAEKAAGAHWKQVYLSEKCGTEFKAVLLEKRKPRSLILIPDLALETQVNVSGRREAGDVFAVKLLKTNISLSEAVWEEAG